MTASRALLVMGVLIMIPCRAAEGWVTTTELERAASWAQNHLSDDEPRQSGLQVVVCHGGVLRNERAGRPLCIAGQPYTRGILTHASSRVLVHLATPARTFTALLGVDSNEQTRPGRGSVVFSVRTGAGLLFESPVLREGMPAATLSVNLDGASSFLLDVSDAGDGIGWDHADWADACVTLVNGDVVWLSDLPEIEGAPAVPFSFIYDGLPSSLLLPTWPRQDEVTQLDAERQQRITTWTDPRTALEVRCVALEYRDFPAVEWTLRFRNGATQDTPILEAIQALDTRFRPPEDEAFTLHHAVGSVCAPSDYQPLVTVLPPGASKRISAAGGRPTNTDLCYFNLDGGNEGVIIAFGWPGQWAATFDRDDQSTMHVSGGQELTHFALHPGEEARSPLLALLFWQGSDWIRAQNTWRRWMLAHNLPRPGGQPVPTHYGSCWSVALNPDAEEELAIIEGFEREGIRLDYYFIDAGWYPHPQGGWQYTGTWTVDTQRFPRGVRQIADYLHERGTKFVLWFEPERVTSGSWLAVNHPDWVLNSPYGQLLNLGNPEAWDWAVETIDGLLTSEGVDVYREDFNIDPLACWRGADAPDRQGLTEMRHVEGHLALWDELLRRHPELIIDTCASGGRRNDLETLRRSVPLLRSDCFSPSTTQQAHTMGLSLWMPYYGSGMAPGDRYAYRSCIFPASRIGLDTRLDNQDYALLKQMIAEFRRMEPFLLGDFYPLTQHSLTENVWAAWQFDRPEMGEGMIQVFRRDASPYETARLQLRGVESGATYQLQDIDQDIGVTATGEELLDPGLLVHLPQPHSSRIIHYNRAKR